MTFRGWALSAALVLSVPALAAPAPAPDDTARAKAVITRTKTARATYAIYTWTVIRLKGADPVEEWSAEFNSGKLHRVETPRDRVVADCQRKTGAHRSLADGTTRFDGPIANTACGIAYDDAIRQVAWLGKHPSPWGEVDRVRLWGAGLIRTYDVTKAGVIVSSTFAPEDNPGKAMLEMRTVALEKRLPGGKIFTRASLARSVVPVKFTLPPQP